MVDKLKKQTVANTMRFSKDQRKVVWVTIIKRTNVKQSGEILVAGRDFIVWLGAGVAVDGKINVTNSTLLYLLYSINCYVFAGLHSHCYTAAL